MRISVNVELYDKLDSVLEYVLKNFKEIDFKKDHFNEKLGIIIRGKAKHVEVEPIKKKRLYESYINIDKEDL